MKTKDWIAIGIGIITVIAGILIWLFLPSAEGKTVEIYRDGTLIEQFPMEAERTYRAVQGDAYNLVVIENGGVRVTEYSCPDGLCAKQGTISHAGEQIVCLPNRLVIRIRESGADAPDAVAQ